MLHILVILVLIGLGVWAVNTLVPMDAKIKKVFNVLVVIFVILWLLSVFGLFTLPHIRN